MCFWSTAIGMAVPETSRPWPGEVDLSGFRGAALNQSRSASGVYTGLVCWHECGYQGSASCGRRKMRPERVSAECRFRGNDASSLTRSLTLRPFGCGGRCRRAHNRLIPYPQNQGITHHRTCAQKKERTKRPRRRRFFHRLRPPDGVHITDAFFCASVGAVRLNHESASGDETRRGLKIITVSGESLPPAPPRSRHIGYRIPFRLSPLRDTWRFLIAHVFWYLGPT